MEAEQVEGCNGDCVLAVSIRGDGASFPHLESAHLGGAAGWCAAEW